MEKEALDDISMELELADEDQPVMYVLTPTIVFPHISLLTHLPHSFHPAILQVQNWRSLHPLAPSTSCEAARERLGRRQR